jgi:hypothetical protein
MGRIDVDDMPGDEPVQQHAERSQVLLDGRRRHLGLQVLNESGNMERLDAGKLVEVSLSAPGGESSGGVHIGPACVIVVDLAGEKFQDALCGLWCGREERRRLEIRRRREDDIGGQAVDVALYLNRRLASQAIHDLNAVNYCT